jgi:hypothetical protein
MYVKCFVMFCLDVVSYEAGVFYYVSEDNGITLECFKFPEDRVRFQALQDFLKSSGSETGSTRPREYNTLLYAKVCINFANRTV